MHAVLVNVRFKAGGRDDATHGLRTNVVPQVKGAPGFVKGTWFSDSETGHGFMVFQSEEQARQMAEASNSVAGDLPIEILDVKVYEVDAEA